VAVSERTRNGATWSCVGAGKGGRIKGGDGRKGGGGFKGEVVEKRILMVLRRSEEVHGGADCVSDVMPPQ